MFHKLTYITTEILVIAGVIIFGAIVHATAQLKVSRDKDLEFNYVDFIILTIIAIFSGMVFGLTSSLFWNNETVVILFSAIGAFLGMAGLNRLATVMIEILTNTLSKK